MSVIFDRLQISDNGSKLYIDVHVSKASYFDNIYLDTITIKTADRVLEASAICPSEDYVYKETFEGNVKEAHLVLQSSDFVKVWGEDIHSMKFRAEEMSRTLFFVYVKIKGVPDECTPCRLDEEVTIGVTFDEALLYQRIMQYVRELSNDCEIPKGFIDLIMLWNGFKAAIETEHFVVAFDFWKKLFSGNSSLVKCKPCGCHG